MIPVIVCGGETGRALVYGYVTEVPKPGSPVEIHEARMILRWEGARGLFGIAKYGPEGNSRITCSVSIVRDICRQVLLVTKEAEEVLNGWPEAE
jgi:hypothetical protein